MSIADKAVPTAAPGSRQPALRLRWCTTDNHRNLTWLAALGLMATAALAVFGLPPIDLHAPPHHLGIMDPLCGMTRGVRLLARGDVTEALRYNPAGPLVPLGGVVVLARYAYGRITGRWADLSVRWTPALITITAVAVGLLWIRQQANADLLR